MLQVRQGVFETNSSSTHSITIVPLSEFRKWENGEVYFNNAWKWDRTAKMFLTKDEAISLAKEGCYPDDVDSYEVSDFLLAYEYDIYSYEEFLNQDYLTFYQENYASEHGDDIVAFGVYGHEG